MREFYKIDHGKAGVLPSSRFVDLIETLVEGFNSEDMAGHMRKVATNEIGSFDCFTFLKWYVGEEVSLDYVDLRDSHLRDWHLRDR